MTMTVDWKLPNPGLFGDSGSVVTGPIGKLPDRAWRESRSYKARRAMANRRKARRRHKAM